MRIARGLLADRTKSDIALKEKLQIYNTPADLRCLVVTLCQRDANAEKVALEN